MLHKSLPNFNHLGWNSICFIAASGWILLEKSKQNYFALFKSEDWLGKKTGTGKPGNVSGAGNVWKRKLRLAVAKAILSDKEKQRERIKKLMSLKRDKPEELEIKYYRQDNMASTRNHEWFGCRIGKERNWDIRMDYNAGTACAFTAPPSLELGEGPWAP